MRLVAILILLSSLAWANVVSISTSTLPSPGFVGQPYSATVTAVGGCLPYKWAVTGKLPAGLTGLAGSTTYQIKGTPTTVGTSTFTISVTGCGGHVSLHSYTVAVDTHKVALSWKPSPTSGVTYNVLRTTISGSYYAQIKSGLTTTTFTDTSVTAGQTYYYVVDASLNGLTSHYTNQVTAVIP
jgi:hypothetical protein